MNETQMALIEIFHGVHSLIRVCREDQSVMIEQHKLGTLLEDRIQESARRMDTVINTMPHMCELLEAIAEGDEPVATAVGEDETEELEPGQLPEPETETAPEPSEDADPDGADGINRWADTETPEPEPPVDD